jgi:hypothetical protein
LHVKKNLVWAWGIEHGFITQQAQGPAFKLQKHQKKKKSSLYQTKMRGRGQYGLASAFLLEFHFEFLYLTLYPVGLPALSFLEQEKLFPGSGLFHLLFPLEGEKRAPLFLIL